MPAVTLPGLRDAVIFRADLPATEPRRVSDAQLDTLLNRSLLRLQGLLSRFDSEDYFKQWVDLPIIASATGTDLPGNTGKILHIMWKQPSTGPKRRDFIRLEVAKREDIERRGATEDTWRRERPPEWYVALDTDNKRQLRFTPINAGAETILLVMQQQFVLPDDSTEIELDYAWEEWVVLDSTIAIRQRDKQDANDLLGERERTERKIREEAPERFKDADMRVVEKETDFVSLRDPLDVP